MNVFVRTGCLEFFLALYIIKLCSGFRREDHRSSETREECEIEKIGIGHARISVTQIRLRF